MANKSRLKITVASDASILTHDKKSNAYKMFKLKSIYVQYVYNQDLRLSLVKLLALEITF